MNDFEKIYKSKLDRRKQINAANYESRLLLKLLNQEVSFLNKNLANITEQVRSLGNNLTQLNQFKSMLMGALAIISIIAGAIIPLIIKALL